MDNNQKKVTNNPIENSKINCKNNKKTLGLANFTYADYVILSSTLSYAVAEELTDDDLDFLLVFLSQIAADLALIRTKRGYAQKLLAEQAEQTVVEESSSIEIPEDVIVNELGRNTKKITKKKKIKKKRLKIR
ncbi:hypothetical protein [Paraclostridium sordellii]|uniref:Uncharacterized protein n=1 Tax=Paraclostridium sordellii TaxID=1505 RepID=A0A0C7QI58_PARSO|nr:hypothetical protein [Paeniclostridium sordellii]QYE99194.1 hypothetical protein KZ987_06705 [Paeniclostridium sordellii]CEO20788.1 Uncharacterised protein [[Clostridium] sordellii] [Paeniclostridium sordellii]CEP99493.1 Uncharacterised protein [[Clostridium] sordellii] [Paeniclostridium sordellii]CEQ03076.1 Uncharacterised protein [[Clostridium] sordellii] [Paeniclostridium sordellii]